MFNLEEKEPFYKNVSKLEYEDIQMLIDNHVSEGWYVEYKESFPSKNYKVANSIASFANSDGGWYIIGIKEKSGESYADEIVGLCAEEINGLKERIASIVKDRIHPTPVFESKIVNCGENKFVLVVYVDKGKDAPYIADGSIYQRVGEVSDPKPLSDRYLLEKLMDRRKEFKLKINEFCKNEFITVYEFTQPFLEFYVYLDDDNFLFDNFFTSEFMDDLKDNFNNSIELLSGGVNVSAHLDFPNVYSSFNSYILRSADSTDIDNIGCAIEFFINGNFKFVLPFNMIDLDDVVDDYLDWHEGDLKICDLAASMINFDTVVAQYKRLLMDYGFNGNIYVRFNLKNCFKLVPYFNNDLFKKNIVKNGVPISFKSEINLNYDEKRINFNLDSFHSEAFIPDICKSLGVSPKLYDSFSQAFANVIMVNIKQKDGVD